jgi:hypothetical protein
VVSKGLVTGTRIRVDLWQLHRRRRAAAPSSRGGRPRRQTESAKETTVSDD